MSKDESFIFYLKIFRDICQGYTHKFENDQDYFIKHLNFQDQINLQEQEIILKEKALKRGLISEEETLSNLENDGIWSSEDESFIETQKIYVENLKKTKSQLLLKREREDYQKTIDKEANKLISKQKERSELLKNTAENYASSRFSDYYIHYVFYKDSKLSEKPWSKEEFDNLPYNELYKLIAAHNNYQNSFREINVQKMILQDFFVPYMYTGENSNDLFGIPACKMTHLQLSVIMHSKVFKNIFENHSNIPEDVKKDPDKLLEFTSQSAAKEKSKDNLNKEGASTVFGATDEDYAQLGVDKDSITKNTLGEAARKKGGALNMEDLMKLQGI